VSRTITDQQADIIDNSSSRILNELSATRSRCDSLQQSKKEKNESLSHESLKEEMNWICVLRARFNLDSDRSRRQEASQITRSAEKDRKLFNDSDSHRENRFCEFSSSSQNSRREVDLLSMRLKQSDDKTCHNVLLVNERSKSTV
jgi:hypothetical protein